MASIAAAGSSLPSADRIQAGIQLNSTLNSTLNGTLLDDEDRIDPKYAIVLMYILLVGGTHHMRAPLSGRVSHAWRSMHCHW